MYHVGQVETLYLVFHLFDNPRKKLSSPLHSRARCTTFSASAVSYRSDAKAAAMSTGVFPFSKIR